MFTNVCFDCLCLPHSCSACRGQKRASDLLGPEVQIVFVALWALGPKLGSSGRELPSLQPLTLLSYPFQDHLPRGGCAHSRLASHITNEQENAYRYAHRAIWWKCFFEWDSLTPSSLCQIDQNYPTLCVSDHAQYLLRPEEHVRSSVAGVIGYLVFVLRTELWHSSE